MSLVGIVSRSHRSVSDPVRFRLITGVRCQMVRACGVPDGASNERES